MPPSRQSLTICCALLALLVVATPLLGSVAASAFIPVTAAPTRPFLVSGPCAESQETFPRATRHDRFAGAAAEMERAEAPSAPPAATDRLRPRAAPGRDDVLSFLEKSAALMRRRESLRCQEPPDAGDEPAQQAWAMLCD
jgi:hypothetical protein